MQSSFLKQLLAFLALISFAKADYYIDDQNYTSLLYSENPGGPNWRPFREGGSEELYYTLPNGTMVFVDASQCFNYTYTYAPCTVADNCQLQIPFTGSGIAIYILQAGELGINASLAIDGGVPQYNALPAPPGPDFYISNVTLFSIYGHITGNHTATMTVQSWDNNPSGLMFDYALINQTIVSPTASSVASSPSTTYSSTAVAALPSFKSTVNVDAIVGGIVGGVAAFSAIVLVIFYLRRRSLYESQRVAANLDAEPQIEQHFSPESLYLQHTIAARYTDVPDLTPKSLVTDPVSATCALPQSMKSGSSPSRREKSQLRVTNPSENATQISNSNNTSAFPQRARSFSPYAPSTWETSPSSTEIRQTHPMLSDDQADLVNNLYANNVPASAIVRVIERMLAGEWQPAVDENRPLSPPSYHHVTSDD